MLGNLDKWRSQKRIVVSDRLIAPRSAGDSGAYLFVFQGFSEPIGIIAAIPRQPVHIWYATEQSPSTDVIADLSGGDKEVQRPSFAITDGVQLGIHAAFGSANQAATHLFLTCLIPRFDGVILSLEWKEALWDKFVMAAPRPRTPS